MNGETPLPICRVGELEASDDQPRWLVESLWSHQAVGFVAGQPKLGLCRARHKPSHAASWIMPRDLAHLLHPTPRALTGAVWT